MNLGARFQSLTVLLQGHEHLWRPVPFYRPELPWEADCPALATALRALDDGQLSLLESETTALLTWLTTFVSGMEAIATLQQLPLLPTTDHDYSSHFQRDIPGRKWQQITAFVGAMHEPGGRVLEWCAGKGHLGRAIGQRFQSSVTGLEWDSDLCRKGNALSTRHGVDVHLQHCDVLSPEAADYMDKVDHVVALHACGDLHRRLLETVSARQMPGVSLSPCCYHLSADPVYRPFSRAGRHSGLQLSRDDCRLAVQETVTAPAQVRRKRDRKNAWRLGFDRLQRELRAKDEYLPVPPVPDALLQGNFAEFCRTVAALKGLTLPAQTDWAALERSGWQRLAEVSRMELPRHAFRRVLELWLVLDRALFLQDSGYQVTVSRFCKRALTPRNLLISASGRTTDLRPQPRRNQVAAPGEPDRWD